MARPRLAPDMDEDEIVPDSELEFEDLEHTVQNESSGGSSDDFVPDESSQSDAPQDEESDVPVRISKATLNTSARPSSSKAGPSSSASKGRRSTTKVQFEADSSDPSDTDDPLVARTNAPQRRASAPTRGKGRRNAVQPRRRPGPQRRRGRRSESDESESCGEPDNSDSLLEPSDDDAQPPPKDLLPNERLVLIKVALRRMRKKLGRKLTLVRLSIVYPRLPCVDHFSSRFLAGEVNGTTPPLSPRTKELLGRSQEVHRRCYSEEGGAARELAGHPFTVPRGKLVLDEETGMWSLARWDPGRECVRGISVCVPPHLRSQDEMGMGKTIQMISLLVSEEERPNLVIA